MGWRENRELAASITVQRVARRLNMEREMKELAAQRGAQAAVRREIARKEDPAEWKKGEMRWRYHRRQVDESIQARAAVRA